MSSKLYVIEDDSVTVMLLKRYIKRAEWDTEIIHFEYGTDAVAHMIEGANDAGVLLLDLNLPDMHGVDILQVLRNSPKYAKLPVIVLTTSNLDHERQACLDLGVSHFLEKPFNFDLLVSYLRELDVSFVAA
ncbi:MAG: response regulator [Chloroflexota bacterium]